MQLRWRLSPSGLLQLYREPRGTLTFVGALGLACLATAAGFGWLAGSQVTEAWLLLALFSGCFALAGLAALAQLPRLGRDYQAADGVPVLTVSPSGLVTKGLAGDTEQTLAWPLVDKIVLAERLRIVESDGVSRVRRAWLVFPAPAAKLAGLDRTAGGRRYLLTGYPDGQAAALLPALRALAPAAVTIVHHAQVEFNLRTGTDSIGLA